MAELIRDHRSVLAAAEKRALVSIAQRLPASIHSDHLTALALLAMAAAGAAYALARWDVRCLWIAIAALAVNWFGDSLDGTVARVRHVERPRYGFYIDHVLDIVGATCLFAGLAASGFMAPALALSMLVAYLLVSGEVFLATSVRGVFRMSFGGVGPTELRILLAIGTVALFGDPHVDLGSFGRLRLFDFAGLIAIAGMAVTLTINVILNATALAREERNRGVRLSPDARHHQSDNNTLIRFPRNSPQRDGRRSSTQDSGSARRTRRADTQPQEHRRHAAARQADHHYGCQRLRKVVAGLRHDLR